VFVSASNHCFKDLSFDQMTQRLVDLQFDAIELMIDETHDHLKPSEVLADTNRAISRCREMRRLAICAISANFDAPDEDTYYKEFQAICHLAKIIRVITITVRSAELGTPFNEEIERLKRLISIAQPDGIRIGLLTEQGRMTQDPDTAVVFCNNVRGLGITLDPTQYVYGGTKQFDQVLPHVYHVRLRDSSETEFQVQIGQGKIEFGRIISQLEQCGYDRGLCVDIREVESLDTMAEMRKMRLLLESLV